MGKRNKRSKQQRKGDKRNDHDDDQDQSSTAGEHLNDLIQKANVHYQNFYEDPRQVEDLQASLQVFLDIVSKAPAGDERKDAHNKLGRLFLARYKLLGDASDLDEAVSHSMEVAEGFGSDREKNGNDLAISLLTRFHRRGNLEDLEKAISIIDDILRGRYNTEGNPVLLPFVVCSLARVYLALFYRLGEQSYAERAFLRVLGIATTTPSDPLFPIHYGTAGETCLAMFKLKGDKTYIDYSITASSEAVQLTPESHPDRILRLWTLGKAYNARYKRFQEPEDSRQATIALLKAIAVAPAGHPERAAILDALADTRLALIKSSEEDWETPLSGAIKFAADAVELTPVDQPDLPQYLQTLAKAHEMSFRKTGNGTHFYSSYLAFR
jgi:tetratricopeptide (TPR) repeat protein